MTLISDNAKTFKAASRDIVKIARLVEVTKFLNSCRISWKFIVEKAPWWGGLGEANQECQMQFKEEHRKE